MEDNTKKQAKKFKTSMPEQEPSKRVKNFEEVALGYKEEQALMEASRCIQCKIPKCIDGCPVGIDIKSFINMITKKDYKGALEKIREKNSLPAICGRVCPQEDQCEKTCVLGIKNEPVGIGRLERFVADLEEKNVFKKGNVLKKTNKNTKIAIVGSGPAGLTCAGELAKMGYEATIFEALHEPDRKSVV
jgi:glutamate synthase (NADPH/NADH) small chain